MNSVMTKLSRDTMRIYNQKLVLKLIKERGPLSKTQLSKMTELTVPSVTDILSELETYQLIENIGQTKSKRGRYPSLHKVNASTLNVIGVTIGSVSIRSGICDLDGKIHSIQSIPLPDDPSPEKVLSIVVSMIDQYKQSPATIYGIGVGMHGIVDPLEGVAVYPPHLNWDHFDFAHHLEEATSLPVLMDNDCNTLALAERWFGKGQGTLSSIILNVDYGIGAGIIVQDRLFHGVNFGGGQVGHTIVAENGPKCVCGNYGCLETLASEPSITKETITMAKKGFPTILKEWKPDLDTVTIDDIYKACGAGDKLAIEVIERAGRYVGIAISTIVNLFNPGKIILTGGILQAQDDFFQPMKENVFNYSLKTNTKDLILIPSTLGVDSDVIGAASLWVNEVLTGDMSLGIILGQ
ncbi:ROK family transcriptional regulator (plasmid) [Rossellomorea sp. FS2]|uniref:ROK family transcriptional regulator n=1 Tax=Rossellomorea sp. FS2 TaxID=3391447 RepID=UPI003A4D66C2